MPANMPQVMNASLSELLKILQYSEIEAVMEMAKLKHTEASGTLWLTESIQTTGLLVIVVNATTRQYNLYNPTKNNLPISRHNHVT